MRTNPFLDSLKYMFTVQSWTTVAFDVLLLAGIILAILVYRRYPEQRTVYHVWTWLARTVMGAMWWQQVIWKVPPNYGGLRFWTSEMVKYASTDLQRAFVSNVVLGHFSFFAPQVFAIEVLISVDATARRLVPFRLIAGCGHGHQPVAGPVSVSWRMAMAVCIPDCRHGPVFPGTAGAQSGPGYLSEKARPG